MNGTKLKWKYTITLIDGTKEQKTYYCEYANRVMKAEAIHDARWVIHYLIDELINRGVAKYGHLKKSDVNIYNTK